jgi:pimeloyl-ACP methyl ester carboxylesterase
MSTSQATGEREHTLPLPDNRQLAYADNGNRSSTTVVLFFSGYFSVGNASYIPEPLKDLDVHFVAPTLPGNGESSTVKGVPYSEGLCRDMTALLEHLHPGDSIRKLYIGGGSYGSVQAQILYG